MHSSNVACTVTFLMVSFVSAAAVLMLIYLFKINYNHRPVLTSTSPRVMQQIKHRTSRDMADVLTRDRHSVYKPIHLYI